MNNTILVGIDGSETSRRAAEFAASVAKSKDLPLVVAYVIEWSAFTFNTPQENEERHMRREEEITTAREKVLNPMLHALEKEGVKVSGIVRHGQVADVLIQIGKEKNADQLVLGRIGQSKIKTMIFGSVAAKLVQLSDIPITIVP